MSLVDWCQISVSSLFCQKANTFLAELSPLANIKEPSIKWSSLKVGSLGWWGTQERRIDRITALMTARELVIANPKVLHVDRNFAGGLGVQAWVKIEHLVTL